LLFHVPGAATTGEEAVPEFVYILDIDLLVGAQIVVRVGGKLGHKVVVCLAGHVEPRTRPCFVGQSHHHFYGNAAALRAVLCPKRIVDGGSFCPCRARHVRVGIHPIHESQNLNGLMRSMNSGLNMSPLARSAS
jgi:hypothetical protein